MDKTQFLDVLSVWEEEMRRRGLTIDQIEAIEIDAVALSQNEFNLGVEEYLRTVVRLSNSELFIAKEPIMTGEQMLTEIKHRKHRERREHNDEFVKYGWLAVQVGVIIGSLLSIAGHVKELWDGLASGL